MIRITTMRNKEWTCCFGLHVRTATILIGVWHLFLNVLALGFLAVIVRHPAMVTELQNEGYEDEFDLGNPPLPTPVSIDRPPHYAYRDHSLNYHNIDMGGLVCLCMIAITLMLIYGAIKGKPSHLLPFFCLQLFDFAITTLTAAGYLCYLRSVHRLIAESQNLPWRDDLLKLNPQTLSVIVLFSFISVVFLKAYAIGIIWRCYKYLTVRQHNIRSTLPYIIPEVSAVRQERDYSSLLPDYEEAILKQAPPPSYSVAVANGYQATVILPAIVGSPSTSRNVEAIPPPPPYEEAATEENQGQENTSEPVQTTESRLDVSSTENNEPQTTQPNQTQNSTNTTNN